MPGTVCSTRAVERIKSYFKSSISLIVMNSISNREEESDSHTIRKLTWSQIFFHGSSMLISLSEFVPLRIFPRVNPDTEFLKEARRN